MLIAESSPDFGLVCYMLNVLTQPDVRSAPGPLAVAAAVHSIGRFHEIENRSMKFHEIS